MFVFSKSESIFSCKMVGLDWEIVHRHRYKLSFEFNVSLPSTVLSSGKTEALKVVSSHLSELSQNL